MGEDRSYIDVNTRERERLVPSSSGSTMRHSPLPRTSIGPSPARGDHRGEHLDELEAAVRAMG